MKLAHQLFAAGLSAALFLPVGAEAQQTMKEKARDVFNVSFGEWEKIPRL